MQSRPSDCWVRRLRASPAAALKLFCFPYAGGGTSAFSAWSEFFPTAIEVCAINLPGREDRLLEEPFDRLSPLIEELAVAISPHLDRPFVFFGHSMGALLAFELTRRLRRERKSAPLRLLASGCVAPQCYAPGRRVHEFPEQDFINELRTLNGTPEEVLRHPELLQLLLPALRADFALCWAYGYGQEAPLDCAVSVYGGLGDMGVDAQDLLAWREQTSGSFTAHFFAGDHFFLHTARRQLLGAISRDLSGDSNIGFPPAAACVASRVDVDTGRTQLYAEASAGSLANPATESIRLVMRS